MKISYTTLNKNSTVSFKEGEELLVLKRFMPMKLKKEKNDNIFALFLAIILRFLLFKVFKVKYLMYIQGNTAKIHIIIKSEKFKAHFKDTIEFEIEELLEKKSPHITNIKFI